jgi:hypothetical protein
MNPALIKRYQQLGPTTLFGLQSYAVYTPRIVITENTQPTFVALGDSFTWGHELEYHQTWPSVVTQQLGWNHINLSWGGSSIENMERILVRSLSIQHIPHMAVLTYPWRSESKHHWLGDRWRRIRYSTSTLAEQVDKIQSIVSRYPTVWFSTVWGYPNDLVDACRNIEQRFSNFKLNPIDWLDRTGPNGHAGPISQQSFANFLIKEFFNSISK